MTESKKVPLFIADVKGIADGDLDEWAVRMAEYVARVTGLPLEEDPSTDSNAGRGAVRPRNRVARGLHTRRGSLHATV